MVPAGDQAEEAIVADAGKEEAEVRAAMGVEQDGKFSMTSLLWHGGSVWDAWFSCASNQVAQVLLTLPYSFSQLGMLSGLLLQVFYGLMGSWTAYLISVLYVEYRARKEKEGVSFKNHVIQWFEVLDGLLGPYWKAAGLAFNCTFLLFGSVIQLIACASNIYYINDRLDKRTWTYIFGACCSTTVFIPSFHNYRIWSFLGLGMTTYTAWYLAIAAAVHGQVDGVTHSGPSKMVLYFTGATNILYTFGGHAVTVEIMHAMWKPQKFKYIYLVATLYVFTLTLPSASAMYWAFGDALLTHSNAFSLLPRSGWRDAAVILMLIHQFITFGFACTPLYFVWEKAIGMHGTLSVLARALARLPIVVPIWFLAIIFPFFGPINSAVGALLVSFTVYIIPSLAHILTYRSASARLIWNGPHKYCDQSKCSLPLWHQSTSATRTNSAVTPRALSLCCSGQTPTGSVSGAPQQRRRGHADRRRFIWSGTPARSVGGDRDGRADRSLSLFRLSPAVPAPGTYARTVPCHAARRQAAARREGHICATSTDNAAEKPPPFLPSWSGMFVVNVFVVAWVLVVGFGLGGWASVTNFIKQIDTFGLFAKCYQCPPRAHAGAPLPAPPRH
uniref:Amino acid transporter transmembrane domain-containing protein n=1 Tax=Oryza meridionalis TaxID=40149 RepID=A0A0E0DS80_9ORYZ